MESLKRSGGSPTLNQETLIFFTIFSIWSQNKLKKFRQSNFRYFKLRKIRDSVFARTLVSHKGYEKPKCLKRIGA